MGILDDIKATFKNGSSLTRLIIINIAFFIAVTIVSITGFLLANPVLTEKAVRFLSVPSSLKTLMLKPWTLITYMFTHKELLHILVNLMWLYWFGKIFLQYLDQRKLVGVYVLGGISGAAMYVLSYNIFPAFSQVVGESIPLLGASASVMAIVVAIAAYVPDYTVLLFLFGQVRIKYIALVIFILTSILDFSANSGGKLAHIGGALFGYIFTLRYRQGSDITKGFNRILDWFVVLFKPKQRIRVTYRKPSDDLEYNKQKMEHQKGIDKILEKISKGGYDSLTKEEKEMLFRESQKKH